MSIYLSDKKISRLVPIKYCNFGCFGNVYYFENDAIKLIRNPRSSILPNDFENNMLNLCKIKSDGVGLPKELVYNNEGFKGYIMDYFPGQNLVYYIEKIKDKNLDIDEATTNLLIDSFINKIIDLSDKKVLVRDVIAKNLIKLDNDIKIVDCDFYRYEKDKSSDEIFYKNKRVIEYGMDKLINSYNIEFCHEINKKLMKKL